jgi:[ribosomal protein S18]-alanine N-acetyltransferase
MTEVRVPEVGVALGGVRLRGATVHDVAGIVEIERASFSDPWSAGSFRSLLSTPLAFFTLATDAGTEEVLGYVIALRAIDEAEIANLAVAPAWRGRGLGAMLLDHAVGAVAARGVSKVYLEVRSSNAAARALYASRGFSEIGIRSHYYRRPVEDALVLRRSIAPETR